MSMVTQGDAVAEPTPLSMKVIEAIAQREGIDPVELQTPIYEVVDLDALDALTRGESESTSVEISFTYEGYEVTVDNDRDVGITSIDE